MPSVREIGRRIRSVQNTAKITKAMSMIAASKMRRAQDMAVKSRPYSDRMRELLSDLVAQPQDEDQVHPLLSRRDVKNTCLIVITPDRGLTGGLHSRINRIAGQFNVEHSADIKVIAIGKKGRDFVVRTDQNLKAVFTDLSDRPLITDVTPVAKLVMDEYISGQIDDVHVVYARFINTTVQRVVVEKIIPVEPAQIDPINAVGYIYEPNSSHVLSELLPRYVEMQLYHAVLESIASEQSARMVAMRNATDNANDMVEDLTLVMNKVRQESITKELLDIVGGAAAVGS